MKNVFAGINFVLAAVLIAGGLLGVEFELAYRTFQKPFLLSENFISVAKADFPVIPDTGDGNDDGGSSSGNDGCSDSDSGSGSSDSSGGSCGDGDGGSI